MTNRSARSVAIYVHDLTGGGAERQVLRLARQFQHHGLDVTLLLHADTGDLRDALPPNLPVRVLGGRRTLGDIPRLARYIRRERPDILLAKLLSPHSPTRVVICQHNALSESFTADRRWTYRLIPWAYRLLSPFAAGAVAVSSGIAAELCRSLPASRIRVIYNAVIDDDFIARSEVEIDHPWFAKAGATFVTAGRLVMAKDHETMLQAFAIHRYRDRSSKLMILGSGPLQDALMARCRELEIADAVAFLGFRDNPLPYFRQADCFVLSSVSEGFGNVLVEALGCGTPVIATDCPHGPAEILGNGRFGALTPTGDPDKLAAAMDRGLMLRANWPKSTLQLRAAEFSDTTCAMKYMALFTAVLSDSVALDVLGAMKHPAGTS